MEPSRKHDHPEPILIPCVKYDFEFYWNFKLRIKNNSSKTAYNIRIEEIEKNAIDYLEKQDDIVSLKAGDEIELDYKLKYRNFKMDKKLNNFYQAFQVTLKGFK